MAFDATVGGVNANSYVSVADADAYFLNTYGRESWASLDDGVKEALLQEATRALDLYYKWIGYRATETQALGWPRKYATYSDFREIPEDVIPSAVIYATCDLAFHIFTNSGLNVPENDLDMIKVGSITIDFNDFKGPNGFPKTVLSYLGYYGESIVPNSGGISTPRLIRT